ncbi:uncharacterized protein LOC110610803 [Manihot esculenta]|uniref:Transmembrane protein n=1 Tax=Manihot esculenta TaxID=3983 RepID=A0A2C9W5Y5_MANES|nr:uncharacterized protein LOC110610803 [Manihot esculenta]OAY54036.1 hypothetical protein MANES_03G043400v8 [Manihot esculenta]
MERVDKFFRNISKDLKSASSSSESPYSFSGKEGLATALSSSDQSRVLMTRPNRHMVSLWTCSKLCSIFFVAGVVVGYTLKTRVRRWASKLLKRLKDD